jgi:hypothetical protein
MYHFWYALQAASDRLNQVRGRSSLSDAWRKRRCAPHSQPSFRGDAPASSPESISPRSMRMNGFRARDFVAPRNDGELDETRPTHVRALEFLWFIAVRSICDFRRLSTMTPFKNSCGLRQGSCRRPRRTSRAAPRFADDDVGARLRPLPRRKRPDQNGSSTSITCWPYRGCWTSEIWPRPP